MELEKVDNPDVLGSLYALRGGLSAISVEYDKARQTDGRYYEQLNRIADQAGGARREAPQGTVEYATWICGENFKNVLIKRYNNIKEKQIEQNNSYEKIAKDNKKDARKSFSKFVVLLLSSIVLLVGIICLVLFGFEGGATGKDGALESTADKITLAVLLLIPLALIITAFVKLNKGIHYSKLYKSAKIKKIQSIESYNNQVNNEAKRVAYERITILSYMAMLPTLKANAQKILGERNATIKPMVQSCNIFYKALLEQFSPLLDERDWQHLDLVIYELETRRADSVKEALQLVDRELQTERIERTVGEAAKAICYTLARGFTVLQQSIKICCDKICDRLDTISSQLDTMSMQMAVQSIQLAGISGRLAELTDSVNVGNALQAKANATSAQLLSDVHAIRYYS